MRRRTAYAAGPAFIAVLALSLGTANAAPTLVIEVDGTLSEVIPPEPVDKIVQGSAKQLLACFTKVSTRRIASGWLTFTIAKTGAVQRARTAEIDTSVDRCILGAVSRLVFPRPKGGRAIEVVYTLVYLPDEETEQLFVALRAEGDGDTSAPTQPPRPPPVVVGIPEVTGGLTAADVRRPMKRRAQRFAWCFEKDLARKRTPVGTATATFTIDAKGAATRTTATGLGDPEIETCIADAITAYVEFPVPAKGSVQVRVPIEWHGH